MNTLRILTVFRLSWRMLIACGVMMLAGGVARGAVTFSWGATTNKIYNKDGIVLGNELTPVSRTTPSLGCFVQLLRTPSGTIARPIPRGNRAGGDNVVIATSWISQGVASNTPGGFIAASFSHSLPSGSLFFVRAWSKASTDYTGGATQTNATVPIDPSVRYGDSGFYVTTRTNGTETFYIAPSFATTNLAGGLPVITTLTDPNGSISPSGSVTVLYGSNQNFVCSPSRYYHNGDVYVNGTNMGTMTNYLWPDVRSNGTIYATFRPDLTTTNSTPLWWLNQMLGVTDSFDAAEFTDTDGDGYKAWEEYFAGSVPTNPQSVFHVTGMARVGGNRTVSLTWPTLSNRSYAVTWSTNTLGFITLTNGLRGIPTLTWTNETVTSTGSVFYRIQVQ